MQYPAKPIRSSAFTGLILAFSVIVLAGCDQPTLQRADGSALDWDSLRGEWVLVNYWAEWCKPCLEEIPELNAIHQDSNVTVLGVNFDGVQGDELTRLAETMGIEFPLLATDPGPQFGWNLPMALPATFVVDPEGNLLEARFGPQTEAELKQLMKP